MIKVPIAVVIVAFILYGLFLYWNSRKPGFRGAIGCRNHHDTELVFVEIGGFSRAVTCQPLKTGEHSFSYLGRQDVPASVVITWQFASDQERRRDTVSLPHVPLTGGGDDAIFLVLGKTGSWTAEYAPRLLQALR